MNRTEPQPNWKTHFQEESLLILLRLNQIQFSFKGNFSTMDEMNKKNPQYITVGFGFIDLVHNTP